MSVLILPSRFTSQPQGPARIDRGNPLTRGLIGAYLPQFPVNLAGGGASNLTRVGTGGSVTPGAAGLQNTGGSPTNHLTLTLPAGLTAGTLLAILHNTSITNIDTPWLMTTDINNTDIFPYSNSNIYTSAWASGRYQVGQAIPAGVNLLLPYVAVQVGSTTATTHATYVNGKLVGAVSNATFAYPSTAHLGTDNIFSPTNGRYLFAVWDRILTAQEIAYLSAHWTRPWQLFQAPPRRLWVPSAAAGTAYTQTLSAASTASAASVRNPRVVRSKNLTATATARKFDSKTRAAATAAVTNILRTAKAQHAATTASHAAIRKAKATSRAASTSLSAAIVKRAGKARAAATPVVADVTKTIVSASVYVRTFTAQVTLLAALGKSIGAIRKGTTGPLADVDSAYYTGAPREALPIVLGVTLDGQLVFIV